MIVECYITIPKYNPRVFDHFGLQCLVYCRRKLYNIYMSGVSKKLDVESIELICSAYASGRGMKWIGKCLGVSVATVRHHLMRSGVVMRPVGRPRVGKEADGVGKESVG